MLIRRRKREVIISQGRGLSEREVRAFGWFLLVLVIVLWAAFGAPF